MELIISRTRKSDIKFYKSGRIEIGKRAARMGGIIAGDTINILQWGDQLYLYIATRARESCGLHQAECKSTYPGGRHLRAFSATLAAEAAEAAEAASLQVKSQKSKVKSENEEGGISQKSKVKSEKEEGGISQKSKVKSEKEEGGISQKSKVKSQKGKGYVGALVNEAVLHPVFGIMLPLTVSGADRLKAEG